LYREFLTRKIILWAWNIKSVCVHGDKSSRKFPAVWKKERKIAYNKKKCLDSAIEFGISRSCVCFFCSFSEFQSYSASVFWKTWEEIKPAFKIELNLLAKDKEFSLSTSERDQWKGTLRQIVVQVNLKFIRHINEIIILNIHQST